MRENGDACYVIAEIGINHNGDMSSALKLIDAAAAAGCEAVKFQKRDINRVYSAEELDRPRMSVFGDTNGDLKRGLEFAAADYQRIFEYSAQAGLDCFASVWDEQSVEFMAAFRPPYLKVPSPLVRHRSLLARCRRTGIPVMLSTGGAHVDDVRAAVGVLGDHAAILLHCISAYPCPDNATNLRQMITLVREFGLPVGYSSHETGPYPVWAAVAMGAVAIERHMTLDRTLWGSDQAMSTEPAEMVDLVAGIRTVQACLGSPDVVRLPIEEPAVAKLARTADYPA